MTDRKDSNNDTTSTFMKDTGMKIGKAIARSRHRAEEVIKIARNVSDELKGTFPEAAEKIIESARKAVSQKKPAPGIKVRSAFRTDGETPIEEGLTRLADEIAGYLKENGETTVEKITNVMMRRKNSMAMVYGAIGALVQAGKIGFDATGESIKIKI